MKNLVFMPSRDLGRFKYIFSKKLRERYFKQLDKAKLKMDPEA